MVILGLYEDHDAAAALMKDGEIVAAVQEERFTGRKHECGYPKNAVNACLKLGQVHPEQIDAVVLASHLLNPAVIKIRRNANFSVGDWVKEQHDFWKPRLFEGKNVNYFDVFRDRDDFIYEDTYPVDHLLHSYMSPEDMQEMARIRKETVARIIGVPPEKVRTLNHEDCHVFYGYFAGPLRGKTLNLTAEGKGDYSNGTVSILSEEEGRVELAATVENMVGTIYKYITLILGMKPTQHEYKVMGLAPYASAREIAKSYPVFERVLKVDGLNIVFDQRPPDLYFHFRRALEGHRFDGIAGALQQFVETLLCQWVENCMAATGLDRVCFSGGVAQNIKACKRIMELEGLKDFFVCPASGDTSLPVGGCYYTMWEHLKNQDLPLSGLKPLRHVYLGPDFGEAEIEEALDRCQARGKYRVNRGATPAAIAGKLADGLIVARCAGRMEFGLRALGNRSIMADPRRMDMPQRLNRAIKMRDFWMPFTPTILAEREKDYLINPKNLQSPFMTLAFDATELARKELIAALHPADFTARPQILTEAANPEYYAIIKDFERLTGVGGVLNTSFNLHGEPIVLGPREALRTFENSGLDVLLLNDFIIEKR